MWGIIICDKVCQWLATDLWICLGTPISATKVVTEIFFENGVKHLTFQWTSDESKVCVCSA